MLTSLYKTCTRLQDQCSPISDSTLYLSFLLWSNSETLQSHIQTKSRTCWFQSRTYWFQPRTCLPTRCRATTKKDRKIWCWKHGVDGSSWRTRRGLVATEASVAERQERTRSHQRTMKDGWSVATKQFSVGFQFPT